MRSTLSSSSLPSQSRLSPKYSLLAVIYCRPLNLLSWTVNQQKSTNLCNQHAPSAAELQSDHMQSHARRDDAWTCEALGSRPRLTGDAVGVPVVLPPVSR